MPERQFEWVPTDDQVVEAFALLGIPAADREMELRGSFNRTFPYTDPDGRRRVSLTLRSLGISLAASTVRNILLRSRPRPERAPRVAAELEEAKPRQIVARHPNHVWSVDRTRVWRRGIFPTWVLAAIDHYFRKVVALGAVEGPNAGWVIEPVEQAFRCHPAPRHLITDQEAVLTCHAFRNLLEQWQVRRRFGAAGQHGSIAVTERLF